MLDEKYVEKKIEKLQNLFLKVRDKIPSDFTAHWGDEVIGLNGEAGIINDMTKPSPKDVAGWFVSSGMSNRHKTKWLHYLNEIYRKIKVYDT